MKSKLIKTSAVLVAALLSACSTDLLKHTDTNVNTSSAEASENYKKATEQYVNLVETKQTSWLGSKSIEIDKKEPLPDFFNKQVTFDGTLTSNEIAAKLASNFGARVIFQKEVMANLQTTTATAGSGGGGANSQNNQNNIKISFEGSLKELLNVVASRFGSRWKYKNGEIVFYLVDTRTFAIKAIPGDVTMQSQVSNTTTSSSGSSGSTGATGGSSGSGSSGPTGGSTSSTSINGTLSVWNGIKDSITGMLSSSGKVVVSQSTGSVTVTDFPEILDRVESYVSEENERLSKQVSFYVKVYNVSLSKSDNYQINWDMVFKTLNQNYGLGFSNSFATTSGSTQASIGILSGATGGASKFAGSDLLFNALNAQGKTSIVTSATVTTLNAQPAPIQVGRQNGYIQSTQTTVTPNVGTTTGITQGIISTGFNMNILPNIFKNGNLYVQYSFDLAVLNELKSVTSGTSTVQIPSIDIKNFSERIAMRSGETLILAGFEQNTDMLQKNGVLSADSMALGGGRDTRSQRDILVISITPIVKKTK